MSLFEKKLKSVGRNLFYGLTPQQRFWIRRLIFFPEKILTKRPEMVPPKGMIFTGGGDFVAQGDKFLLYFVKIGMLKPHDHIIEIGCGIGRMARPLTGFLSEKGSYVGFDIVKSGIDWCQKHIGKRYPNFEFHHFPIENGLYSEGNTTQAKDFVFPFQNESFNFCIATSVFTHMLPQDTSHYFEETSRVLKSGGHCFFTFFIIDEVSRHFMKKSEFNFKFMNDGVFYLDMNLKEGNVGYPLELIYNFAETNGFSIIKHFPGQWSCRPDDTLDFQDILLLRKI
ncbi:MAG: hypothetical protein RJA52_1295 [Bacteroidota bacterium]|jgi:ubiquinone/menaquinone biosynthesis C-methylase UbiE